MKSVDRASDGDGEMARDRECYRCHRGVAPALLFRVDVEPASKLEATYAHSVRYCCEHCAAAMNLSDFSERITKHARRGERPPEE